ncbi:hypothetical protein LguiA_001175 [Lonicera macranthoides]
MELRDLSQFVSVCVARSGGNYLNGIVATGASNTVVKLLPTGIAFMFQYLNPIFTSKIKAIATQLTSTPPPRTLISLGTLWCFLSSFIDSQGNTHYAIETLNGLWSSADTAEDLPFKKLTFKDFWPVYLNTVKCFSESFTSAEKFLLKVRVAHRPQL